MRAHRQNWELFSEVPSARAVEVLVGGSSSTNPNCRSSAKCLYPTSRVGEESPFPNFPTPRHLKLHPIGYAKSCLRRPPRWIAAASSRITPKQMYSTHGWWI